MPGVGSGRLKVLKVLFKVAQQGTCNLVILSLRIPGVGVYIVGCVRIWQAAGIYYISGRWLIASFTNRLSSLSFVKKP